MFVFSVKTSRKQILAMLGCMAVLTVSIVLAVVLPQPAVHTVSTRVSDSAQRVAYLRSQGYEIVENSEEVREIRIPDEPDEALLQYNALQEQAGRSLTSYYGKRVRLYTYELTNDGEPATAHLYVYRDRVIAGDVTVDGDMQAIKGET